MKSITVTELEQKLNDGEEIELLDVREHVERRICHIRDSIFIPMNEVPTNTDKLSRDKMTVIYCHHGIRSYFVQNTLENKFGFTNLYNLSGGIHAWALQVDRKMRRY
jgi:adenylyltransferase/sulfurtransferase